MISQQTIDALVGIAKVPASVSSDPGKKQKGKAKTPAPANPVPQKPMFAPTDVFALLSGKKEPTYPTADDEAEAVEEKTPEEEVREMISFKDSQGYKTGKYPKDTIIGAIRAAKAVGIDPLQYLALVTQESGMGTAKTKKRGKIYTGWAGVSSDIGIDKLTDELVKKYPDIDRRYLEGAVYLKNKIAYAKQLGYKDDLAMQLQAHNGYGMLTPKALGGLTKAYGVDIGSGVSMKKNPLYGKRLVSLMEDFKKNKDIMDLIAKTN